MSTLLIYTPPSASATYFERAKVRREHHRLRERRRVRPQGVGGYPSLGPRTPLECANPHPGCQRVRNPV